MTNERLREILINVLNEMRDKALNMKIKGVAVASVMNRDESTDWIGEMKVGETPFNFPEGWNLIAIAWSKCGESIATKADSGNPDHRNLLGELGFTGGTYEEHDGYKMAFAFSGASSEDDYKGAKFGLERLKLELSEAE